MIGAHIPALSASSIDNIIGKHSPAAVLSAQEKKYRRIEKGVQQNIEKARKRGHTQPSIDEMFE